MTESHRMFDGFFWIEPRQTNKGEIFDGTASLWHHPLDVSSLTKEFRDIPQFCFPDLETIRIERSECYKNEHFTFTLTDANGGRVYGVCLRVFAQGEGKHYDVKRRPKNCLCIITRFPYVALFRVVLLQVHALCLLEHGLSQAREFLDKIYSSVIPISGDPIRICRSPPQLNMQHDFILNAPRTGGQSHQEVSGDILNRK